MDHHRVVRSTLFNFICSPLQNFGRIVMIIRMREGVSGEDTWEKYDPSGIEILADNQKDLDSEISISNEAGRSEL